MKNKNGYSLVLTIMMSVVIMAVLFGTYRVVAALYTNSMENYYIKLAQEAGESGAAMANGCLDKNNHAQTWGSVSGGVGALTPDSDCKGKANSYSSNKYVLENDRVRTTFEVGDLELAATDTAQISATGKTEVLNGAGKAFKTYDVTVKKSVTWQHDLVSQKSVSGIRRTCTVMTSGIYCWGMNAHGQLGNGRSTGGDVNWPDNPNCPKGHKDGVYCAEPYPEGYSSVDSLTPVKVREEAGGLAGKTITDIYTGGHHTCVVASGEVYCWGNNTYGQIGAPTPASREARKTAHSNVPVKVGGALAGQRVVAIGGAIYTSCAIVESGKVYCWGENYMGALGLNSKNTNPGQTHTYLPRLIANGDLPVNYKASAFSTSGGNYSTMCIISSGSVYCWGGFSFDGNPNNYVFAPKKVGGILNGKTVTTVSLDGRTKTDDDPAIVGHACAVANGEVYCWGVNRNYAVGSWQGCTTANFGSGNSCAKDASVPMPKKITLPPEIRNERILDVKAGTEHNCLLTASKKVYCWGANVRGQLGINSDRPVNSAIPRPVLVGEKGLPSGIEVLDISGGVNRGCARMADGRTFCWGVNQGGQLGDGTRINRYNPTEAVFLRPSQNRFIY